MAEPTIGMAFPTTAWTAQTSVTLTDPQSYHQHMIGVYSGTAEVTAEWSVDGVNWALAAVTTKVATGGSETLYVGTPVPYLRLTSSAAFSGFHAAYNTQPSTMVE